MAASSPQGGGQTGYSNTNWLAYAKGRPPYTKSLVDIIYDYRRRQPNVQWQRLVDIGAGNGIAAAIFAKDFEIIHLSDPSAANIGGSIKATDLAERGINVKVETSQSTGEESYKHVGEGVADLVICATAAHFMNGEGLVTSAAKILKPGGTLAIFSYLYPHLQTTELSHALWNATNKLVLLLRQRTEGPLSTVIERGLRNLTSGDGGLDFVPVPNEYFTDKARIAINSSRGQFLYDGLMAEGSAFPGENLGSGPSRVASDEKQIVFESGQNPEADGWEFEVDKEFLNLFAGSLRPIGDAVNEEEFKEIFSDFFKVVDKECPSGKVKVRWPVKIILATRK